MSRPILSHRSTPVIPDSVSADLLRSFAPLKKLSQGSCLNQLEFGDPDKFEGIFDFYVLVCMAIDGAKSNSPSPVQLIIAAAGLASGLLSHMEACRRQIIDDASQPGAQAILDRLSPEASQSVRALALRQVDSTVHVLRIASQELESLKTEWISAFLLAMHAETGQIPEPSTNSATFISDRFLASIGVDRAEFNACMDRPVDR
jgi:hypothetical protein